MAKDRNTIAKRQREVEKREKASRKREKREQRKQHPIGFEPTGHVSQGEAKVLEIFRRYLMTAGKMLCLSAPEIELHNGSLSNMVQTGLLEVESFKGSYSLTDAGFQAMNNLGR